MRRPERSGGLASRKRVAVASGGANRRSAMTAKPHRRASIAFVSVAAAGIAALLLGSGDDAVAQTVPLDRVKLPPGFSIELVARAPSAARCSSAPARAAFMR